MEVGDSLEIFGGMCVGVCVVWGGAGTQSCEGVRMGVAYGEKYGRGWGVLVSSFILRLDWEVGSGFGMIVGVGINY